MPIFLQDTQYQVMSYRILLILDRMAHGCMGMLLTSCQHLYYLHVFCLGNYLNFFYQRRTDCMCMCACDAQCFPF